MVFPELSLTGYQLAGAARDALRCDDPRLDPLRLACETSGVTALCGVPLQSEAGVEIGALLLAPNLPVRSYAKQHLHAEEAPFFVPGVRDLSVQLGGHCIIPAICYESVLPEHVEAAAGRGATLYAACVAKPAAAIAKAHLHYAAMARLRGLPIVVANAVGPCDGFVSGGRSAAWRADGSMVASLEADVPGELVLDL